MKKKFLSKVVLGVSFASCLGGAVLPALGAQTVLADEVVSTNPGSVLNTLIEDAKTVPGLTVNVKHEIVTGDVDALNQTEINKLKQAMVTQKKNHDDYESKANNPDYLIATKPVDFSKKAVVDFFTVNNKFDFADVNIIFNETNELPDVSGMSTPHPTKEANADSPAGFFVMKPGDFVVYKKFFTDKKTGKKIDFKMTVLEVPEGSSANRYIGFKPNSFVVDHTGGQMGNPVKFKAEFFEAGTNTPIKIDFAWYGTDIDKGETYGRNSGTYLLCDALDKPVTLNDGTVVDKTDVSIEKKTFYGKEWDTTVATISDSLDTTNDTANHNRNYEKYLTLERDVSSFEFLWGGFALGFSKLDLNLNVPEYKTTSVDVVVYEKQASPVKADVKFICGSDEIADMQTITGNSGELIAYSPKEVIKSLEAVGYDLVTNPLTDESVFTDKDETFIIEFAPHVETITSETAKAAGEDTERSGVKYSEGLTKEDLSKTITRTIKYVDSTGKELLPAKTETIELTRTAEFNYVTGEVTYSEWTDGAFKSVKAESIDGYKPRTESISELKVNFESEDSEEKIIYDKVSDSGSKISGGSSGNISNNPVNNSSNNNNSVVSAPNTGDAGLILAGVSGGGLAGAAAIAGLIRRKKR